MVWEYLSTFTNVRQRQHFHADDSIDKLNRSVTVIFLIISTLLIGARQLVGTTITCILDHTLTTAISLSYVESVCWAKNTYQIWNENNTKKISQITYYQWLPFILVLIAFCYYVPYLIWKALLKSACAHSQVPIDVSGVVNVLKDSKLYKMKEFNSAVTEAVDYLNNCFICNSFEYRYAVQSGNIVDAEFDANGRLNLIKLNDSYHKQSSASKKKLCCLLPSQPFCLGSSLILKYLLVKVIYSAISIGMFWFINLFLNFKTGFASFGYQMITLFFSKNITETSLWNSRHFPRIVFCDLKIKNDMVHEHTNQFQCSLPANVFFEKIFIFLYFWFLLVAALNCLSLAKWVYIILTRRKFIKNYLNLIQSTANSPFFDRNESRLVNLFITNYIQYDGLLVLLIIKSNLSDIYFKRMIDYLWKTYLISNLDDQDLMQPTPPRHTSTANINGNGKSKLNSTSPVVVPQQPSAIIDSKNSRKIFYDDELSDSKMKLVDADMTTKDDSDYFNNETHQQRPRVQPQQQRTQPGGTYIGFRKEELV